MDRAFRDGRCPAAFGADAAGRIYDGQVSSIEREVLPLVQAMPAAKFDFAPTNGTFAGVRTFALQARQISASVLGEQQPPLDTGAGDNRPDTLKAKDQIVEYFKGAVAYAHKVSVRSRQDHAARHGGVSRSA